jgi:ubiquinol-cytochrome c reductase cytochrome b subunit
MVYALYTHGTRYPSPSSNSWPFTAGAVLVALLAAQIATGALLVVFYVPASAAAFGSVAYLANDVQLGATVRALHANGASFPAGDAAHAQGELGRPDPRASRPF